MGHQVIDRLRPEIIGEVVGPEDADYPALRHIFVHDGEPAVVVRCHNEEDVRTAIAVARAESMPLSVRSGGHSNAGFSTNVGGMVIDVTPIDHVEILDRETGLVRVGAGARWIDVGRVLSPYRLAVSSGDTTSVGVGGSMLGGGIGWMVRKYGLAIDSLRAAELVTADGRVLRASEDEHRELFWALRGGGGNFGVVTSFEFVAHPVGDVHFGTIFYSATEFASVAKGWVEYMRRAPEELTSTISRFPSFGGDTAPPVMLFVCYAGDDPADAEAAIGPLRELGTVEGEDIKVVPYPDVLAEPSELPEGWIPRTKNRFAAGCRDEFFDAISHHADKLHNLYVELRSVGGAMARVAPDTTAFAHRDAEVMVNGAHLGTPEETGEGAALFDAFWEGIAEHTSGAYSNFLSECPSTEVRAAYPEDTYARLARVKAEYDPENTFRLNPNVPPAGDVQTPS